MADLPVSASTPDPCGPDTGAESTSMEMAEQMYGGEPADTYAAACANAQAIAMQHSRQTADQQGNAVT
jgi:hypothetical protein